jgi:hypothetical protein
MKSEFTKAGIYKLKSVSYHFQMERKVFRLTDSCFNIKQLHKQTEKKCFNSDKQQKLRLDINTVFEDTIQKIGLFCPTLTNDDLVFCCLAKLNLSNIEIGYCMGSLGGSAIKQRKYRVNEKMSEAQCGMLFDYIFEERKDDR